MAKKIVLKFFHLLLFVDCKISTYLEIFSDLEKANTSAK